jgi:hypothetical protein
VREVVGRYRKAGATGAFRLRCDSSFFSKYVVQACPDYHVRYSITVLASTVLACISLNHTGITHH